MSHESMTDESESAVSAETPQAKTALAFLLRHRTHFSRLVGSWLGFGGLYALVGGACPCCGSLTCPVGLAGMGIVGGVLTAGFQAWRRFQK